MKPGCFWHLLSATLAILGGLVIGVILFLIEPAAATVLAILGAYFFYTILIVMGGMFICKARSDEYTIH